MSNVLRLPSLPTLSGDDCRLLVESVIDYAIFMLDPNGNVLTWNAGAERIKGWRADEIVGKHFSKFFTPEDIAANKPAMELAQAANVGRVEDEGYRIRKDGSRFWANVVITALRDETGKLRGFGKVTRDLSARHSVEERLRQSEQRFHQLVDAVVDYAIFMLDETGHVATWNAGARRLKGYEADEIIGEHFSKFYTREDREAGKPERILDTVRREGRFEEEGWRVKKDGSLFFANVVINALRDEQGKVVGFAKITRDLTVRREAERAERYREINAAKDEFLATVSHELRTPLNAIVGWATILKKRELDAEIAKPIEVIHRNAVAQVKLVDDILDVSRVITGKFRLDPHPSDVVQVAREALEVVRPSAMAKRIHLELRLETEHCTLVMDPERMQQALWNLLSNAVKFTESGGTITVAVHCDEDIARITVSDDGRGIDPSFLPFVFEPFRQAESSITRRFGGLGLGLALVRHIVELHGGSIAATSEGLGKGSSFVISLPLRADTEEAPGVLVGERVLVVDDEADARDLVAAVLVRAGANVEIAESAAEGLLKVERFHPTFIISDIGMPLEDGYSFMRRVRAISSVPAMALTAFTNEADRARAAEAGFTMHVAKPIDPEVLVTTIEQLARARPSSPARAPGT